MVQVTLYKTIYAENLTAEQAIYASRFVLGRDERREAVAHGFDPEADADLFDFRDRAYLYVTIEGEALRHNPNEGVVVHRTTAEGMQKLREVFGSLSGIYTRSGHNVEWFE